jgi:hypothetical protein
MASLRQLSAALAIAALAACGDPDPGPNPPPPRVVSRVVDVAAGAQCAAGGRAVTSGSDDDGDGVLDDSEVDRTDVVCLPAPATALVRRSDEPASDACPHGGVVITSGIDDDRDAELDDDEIEHRERVCHPAAVRVVAREDAEPAGDRCALGGVAVASGIDDDGDNVLDDAEIDQTTVLCHQAPHAVLVRRDAEPAGEHCALGGTAIRAGADENRDAVLADDEVDQTSYVCAAAPDVVVVRSDAEPAGDHCAHGGTAVRSGFDDDGDGALDDAEIDQVSYVCGDTPAAVLVRSDAEPAGDHCAHGGTAVSSGSDDDGDGVLDGEEVDGTAYVCQPAPPSVVVRQDALPAGEHCPHGGAAIASGVDDDRDGALADDEVDHTAYLCSPAPAVTVTRHDPLPVGSAACPDGGAAVHSGVDDDHDGALADAEIETTTFVCDVAAIIDGDLFLDARTSADQLARYASVRVITGSLIIGVDGIDLPALEVIGDSLIATEGVTSVALPGLTRVGGVVALVSTTLDTLDLSGLAQVGSVSIQTGADVDEVTLPALTTVLGDLATGAPRLSAPLLERVGGDVRCSDPRLPALTTIGGELQLTGSPFIVRLEALTTVSAVRSGAGGDIGWIDLPALTHVAGPIEILGTVSTLEARQLRTLDGALTVTARSLWSLELPALEELHGDLELRGAHNLHELELDALTVIDGSFHIEGAGFLEGVSLPRLTTIRNHGRDDRNGFRLMETGATGVDLPVLERAPAIELENNEDLRQVAVPALRSARYFEVSGTMYMESLSAPVLASVGGLTLSGNRNLVSVAFPSLVSTGDALTIASTPLTDLSGFPVLRAARDILLSGNDELVDLSALHRLTAIERLSIRWNARLTSLAGLGAVRTATEILVWNNPAITSLAGLDGLRVVTGSLTLRGNPVLTDLDGLDGLRLVDGAIEITGSPLLVAEEIAALIARVTP